MCKLLFCSLTPMIYLDPSAIGWIYAKYVRTILNNCVDIL